MNLSADLVHPDRFDECFDRAELAARATWPATAGPRAHHASYIVAAFIAGGT
jgi:hypothetical protein